jgi:uncharacterized protein YnzC (UPF0291/DUF896 family)
MLRTDEKYDATWHHWAERVNNLSKKKKFSNSSTSESESKAQFL